MDFYTPVGVGAELIQVVGAIGDHRTHLAQAFLEERAKSLNSEVRTKVMTGAPAQNLIAEARSAGASMVLVGARSGSHKFLWRSLSVPLELFNSSPVPVMVVGDEAVMDDRSAKSLVFADDLTEYAAAPCRFAAEMTSWSGKDARLELIHVNPLTEEVLASGMEAALAASHAQSPGNVSLAAIYEKLTAELRQCLERHVPELYRDKIGWKARVIDGRVEAELTSALASEPHRIAIFGKHKTVHKKPFYFGKVPFSTAFRLNMPFVVVP